VLDARGGAALTSGLMAAAGLDGLPSDHGLMPEGPAARLHQAVRRALPDQAPAILAEAGRRTADYILAHRIPRPAQVLLQALPRPLATRALTAAIRRHAWTFAGSGRFAAIGPGQFAIAANPVVAGERSDRPLCHWHAAVFEHLFRTLVDDRLRSAETSCCACGDPTCRFVVS
jgi:divinyl protochlorophyllide a 8-vinyl-reductase